MQKKEVNINYININKYKMDLKNIYGVYDPYAVKLYVSYNNSIEYNQYSVYLDYNKKDEILEFFKSTDLIEIQNRYDIDGISDVYVTEETINDRFTKFDISRTTFLYCNKKKTLVLNLFVSKSRNEISFHLVYSRKINDGLIILDNLLSRFSVPEVIKETKFYQIAHNGTSYNLNEFDIKKPVIQNHYYNDLNIDNIIEVINRDRCGILLFSGIPGSGKTTLIKYLTSVVDKKFCNLSIHNIEMFNDPSLQSFITGNLKNSVLILEDCENLIKSRKSSMSNISTLLNLGDGLLGEALKLKIILTYNTANNIDEALLRKGRMLYKHDFKALSVENANILAKELNLDKVYTKETALTDIFNESSDGYSVIENKIGFVK